jgi:hypothetical protein
LSLHLANLEAVDSPMKHAALAVVILLTASARVTCAVTPEQVTCDLMKPTVSVAELVDLVRHGSASAGDDLLECYVERHVKILQVEEIQQLLRATGTDRTKKSLLEKFVAGNDSTLPVGKFIQLLEMSEPSKSEVMRTYLEKYAKSIKPVDIGSLISCTN